MLNLEFFKKVECYFERLGDKRVLTQKHVRYGSIVNLLL